MKNKTKDEAKQDWLAVMLIGAGSSYARGPDKEETIHRVMKIAKSDWKRLYNFKKGTKTTINVVDVSGIESVSWDTRGFFDKDGKDLNRKIEKVERFFF